MFSWNYLYLSHIIVCSNLTISGTTWWHENVMAELLRVTSLYYQWWLDNELLPCLSSNVLPFFPMEQVPRSKFNSSDDMWLWWCSLRSTQRNDFTGDKTHPKSSACNVERVPLANLGDGGTRLAHWEQGSHPLPNAYAYAQPRSTQVSALSIVSLSVPRSFSSSFVPSLPRAPSKASKKRSHPDPKGRYYFVLSKMFDSLIRKSRIIKAENNTYRCRVGR